MDTTTALVIVAVAGLFCVVLSTIDWRVGAVVVVVSQLVGISYFYEGFQVTFGFKPQLFALAGVIGLWRHARWPRAKKSPQSVLLLLVAVAAGSLAWSTEPSNTVTAASELVWLLLVVVVLCSTPDPRWVSRMMKTVFTVTVIGSLLVIRQPFAFEQGNFRGLMENANGLGAIALMAVTLPGPQRRPIVTLLLAAAAALLFVQTDTRSAMLALLLVLPWLIGIDRLVSRRVQRFVYGLVALVTVGFGFVLTLDPTNEQAAGIKHTRITTWSQAWADFLTAPFLGSGFGSTETIIGSSYLLVLRELGLVGLALVVVALLRSGKAIATRQRALLPYFVASLWALFFESWLLAGGSILAVAFWFQCLALQWQRPTETAPATVSSATESVVQR